MSEYDFLNKNTQGQQNHQNVQICLCSNILMGSGTDEAVLILTCNTRFLFYHGPVKETDIELILNKAQGKQIP